MNSKRVSWLLIFFAIISTIFFWNLGKVPFFDPDEGRYAEMSLTMFRTGDWMIPRMNGIIHLHKPPLANWMIAACYQLLGPSEFSARLPSVLLSLILLALLIRLGFVLFDFRTGLTAGGILASSALYVAVSRLVTTDMALTFFTFLTMFAIAHLFFVNKNKPLYFYLAMTGLGLGMLTKGPVAWMITLVPTVIFAAIFKRGFRIPWYHWIFGIILFFAISLSWYLAVILTHEGAWDYFLNYQLLGRIGKGSAGRAHPIFYYCLISPLGFLPWTLLIPAAVKAKQSKQISDDHQSKLNFVACWFLIPFILFSLFRTKLATYIVPLFPPLAFFMSYFWSRWIQNPSEISPRFYKISGIMLGATFFLLALGGSIFILIKPMFVEGIPIASIVILGIFLLTCSILFFIVSRQNNASRLFKLQLATMFGVCLIALSALPAIHFKNSKILAEELKKIRKPGEKILMWGSYYASLPFYLQDRLVEVSMNTEMVFEKPEVIKDYVFLNSEILPSFFQGPERVFMVMKEKRFSELDQNTIKPLYVIFKAQKSLILSNRPSVPK